MVKQPISPPKCAYAGSKRKKTANCSPAFQVKHEERFKSTKPFLITSFSWHARRVQYTPLMGDEHLFRTTGALMIALGLETNMSGERAHPLRCMHTKMKQNKGRHRRKYSLVVRSHLRIEHEWVGPPMTTTVAGPTAATFDPAVGAVDLRVALFHGPFKVRMFEVRGEHSLLELRRILTCKTATAMAVHLDELWRCDNAAQGVLLPPTDSTAFCT